MGHLKQASGNTSASSTETTLPIGDEHVAALLGAVEGANAGEIGLDDLDQVSGGMALSLFSTLSMNAAGTNPDSGREGPN